MPGEGPKLSPLEEARQRYARKMQAEGRPIPQPVLVEPPAITPEEAKELRSRAESLEQLLAQERQEGARLADKVDALTTEVKEKKRTIESVLSAAQAQADEKKALESGNSALAQRNSELEAALASARGQVTLLSDDNARLNTQNDSAETMLRKTVAEKERLKGRVGDLEAELATQREISTAAQEENRQLLAREEAKEREIGGLHNEISARDARLDDLQSQLGEDTDARANLVQRAQQAEAQLEHLVTGNRALTESVQELETQLAAAKDECSRLALDNSALSRVIEQGASAEDAEARARLAQRAQEAESRVGELVSDNQALTDRVGELELQLRSAQAESRRVSLENAALISSDQESRTALNEAKARILELEGLLRTARSDADALRTKNGSLDADVYNARRDNESLRGRVQGLESQLQEAQSHNEQLHAQIQTLRGQESFEEDVERGLREIRQALSNYWMLGDKEKYTFGSIWEHMNDPQKEELRQDVFTALVQVPQRPDRRQVASAEEYGRYVTAEENAVDLYRFVRDYFTDDEFASYVSANASNVRLKAEADKVLNQQRTMVHEIEALSGGEPRVPTVPGMGAMSVIVEEEPAHVPTELGIPAQPIPGEKPVPASPEQIRLMLNPARDHPMDEYSDRRIDISDSMRSALRKLRIEPARGRREEADVISMLPKDLAQVLEDEWGRHTVGLPAQKDRAIVQMQGGEFVVWKGEQNYALHLVWMGGPNMQGDYLMVVKDYPPQVRQRAKELAFISG